MTLENAIKRKIRADDNYLKYGTVSVLISVTLLYFQAIKVTGMTCTMQKKFVMVT